MDDYAANIGPHQRRRRLLAGAVEFVVGLIVWMGLVAVGADRWWRLALLPFFFGAAAGFFQWRDKT
jgi:hypothetical protein